MMIGTLIDPVDKSTFAGVLEWTEVITAKTTIPDPRKSQIDGKVDEAITKKLGTGAATILRVRKEIIVDFPQTLEFTNFLKLVSLASERVRNALSRATGILVVFPDIMGTVSKGTRIVTPATLTTSPTNPQKFSVENLRIDEAGQRASAEVTGILNATKDDKPISKDLQRRIDNLVESHYIPDVKIPADEDPSILIKLRRPRGKKLDGPLLKDFQSALLDGIVYSASEKVFLRKTRRRFKTNYLQYARETEQVSGADEGDFEDVSRAGTILQQLWVENLGIFIIVLSNPLYPSSGAIKGQVMERNSNNVLIPVSKPLTLDEFMDNESETVSVKRKTS